jgi:hypothetical protein
MSSSYLPRLSQNPRLVYLEDRDYTYKKLGLLLWLTSVVYYKRRYYKVDKLMFNWTLFTAASFFASMGYAKFLAEPTLTSAAKINNMREC